VHAVARRLQHVSSRILGHVAEPRLVNFGGQQEVVDGVKFSVREVDQAPFEPNAPLATATGVVDQSHGAGFGRIESELRPCG